MNKLNISIHEGAKVCLRLFSMKPNAAYPKRVLLELSGLIYPTRVTLNLSTVQNTAVIDADVRERHWESKTSIDSKKYNKILDMARVVL